MRTYTDICTDPRREQRLLDARLAWLARKLFVLTASTTTAHVRKRNKSFCAQVSCLICVVRYQRMNEGIMIENSYGLTPPFTEHDRRCLVVWESFIPRSVRPVQVPTA